MHDPRCDVCKSNEVCNVSSITMTGSEVSILTLDWLQGQLEQDWSLCWHCRRHNLDTGTWNRFRNIQRHEYTRVMKLKLYMTL